MLKKGEPRTMNFKTIQESNDAVVINESNCNKIKDYDATLSNSSYWNKFLISNVYGFKRNQVLKILLNRLDSYDLIPLSYNVSGKGAFFFARNCKNTILELCTKKLTVGGPDDDSRSFEFNIILKYTTTDEVKVDLSENINKVLTKRFKSGVLCLNSFCDDPNLDEFIHLSQPRLLAFVLNSARGFEIKAIQLCNNGIKNLDALKVIPVQTVTCLDLRNNQIVDLAELRFVGNFNVTQLWLEGNPLCALYDEHSYAQNVIEYCPKIEKLDGFLLRQNGFPSFRRNFLCRLSAHSIIDDFLRLYFPTFDARRSVRLASHYHKDASFSLTTDLPQGQFVSYEMYNRNLLNISNSGFVARGSTEIVKLFLAFPTSEHDPYSFTVDVVYSSDKCTVVVVTGVFREVQRIDKILGFNRCFVFECRDKSYRITNEQLHIFNASASQKSTAFKRTKAIELLRNPVHRNQMVNAFAIITNLHKDWARMFLEECNYNLKHATLVFVHLYARNHIPDFGFNDSASSDQ